MTHPDKIELISLLTQMKRILPPIEERKFHTVHYAQVEKRIEEAITKLQDEDYQLIQSLTDQLVQLKVEGKLPLDKLLKYAHVIE